LRLSILAALSLTATAPGLAQTETEPAPPPAGNEQASLDTIVVTGSTSKRTLLNASVDVTLATAADLEQKAPRATADVLSLIPGVFVESTAGPVSNNYSVRGLPGGAQTFVNLEEDGMPVVYGGGGADEYFQNDITIERVEAVQGGTSGVLTPNGAGMTVNFRNGRELTPGVGSVESRSSASTKRSSCGRPRRPSSSASNFRIGRNQGLPIFILSAGMGFQATACPFNTGGSRRGSMGSRIISKSTR